MSYVYMKSEPGLWTVGFYDPAGKWRSESDHGSADEAANRVAWLNGAPRQQVVINNLPTTPMPFTTMCDTEGGSHD